MKSQHLACCALAVVMAMVALDPVLAQGGLSLADAARTALTEQPNVHLAEQRLDASRGDLRAVEGIFDINLTSGFNHLRSETANTAFEQEFRQLPPTSTANLSTLTGGFSKLLRGGQVVSSGIELRRSDVGAVPPVANRASVSIFVSQPLRRGRGEDVAYAPVRAGRFEVDATTSDLRYLKSAAVLSTAVAYWNYVAAVQRLDVFLASELRAREIVDQTQVLIGAGNRPAADLKQVQASLASRISQRIGGEQALYEARQSLGIAIGLPYPQIGALPLPADPFPEVPSALPTLEMLTALAVERRADLESSRRRIESASALLVVAQDNVRPKLDVSANVGYSGLDEGSAVYRYLTPLGNRLTGPQATVGISWEMTPPNNQALGRLARTQSQLSQARIESLELERQLTSSVAVALDGVRRSADRRVSAREAVDLYRSAVQDQRELQQLGVSTIIDLINTEDRLTAAQLDELTALQNLSIAITRLRFETGTLLAPGDQVDSRLFVTTPGAP